MKARGGPPPSFPLPELPPCIRYRRLQAETDPARADRIHHRQSRADHQRNVPLVRRQAGVNFVQRPWKSLHNPSSGHSIPLRIRGLSAAMAGTLILCQALSLCHMVLHPHVISPVGGRITHPASESSGPVHQHDSAGENPGGECQAFVALTPISLISPAAQLVASGVSPDCGPSRMSIDMLPLHQRVLFRLSPSHSPPFSAC